MIAKEIAKAILQPHFDAVRDEFIAHRPAPGHPGLQRLKKTRFVVDPAMHDTPRHFAACRDDGMLLMLAPEIVDLPIDTLVAILAHEFGHATDYAYPAEWLMPPGGAGKATWIGSEDSKALRRWQRLWRERGRDLVEWSADGIAEAVTGKRLGYCGDCLVQCFQGGIERPAGLR